VTADHDADRIALDQGVGHPDIALARNAIDLVDIVRFEAFGQQAGSVWVIGGVSFWARRL
jgi:hypothetical protein